jgi:tetratricopeptide (TPR) repeat protein
VTLRKEHTGPEHADTLAAMFALAAALGQQGDRDAALTVYDEALDLQNRVLRQNSPLAVARKAEYARFVGTTAFLGLRPQSTDRAKQQRAIEIVQRAIARDLPPAFLWCNLACAQYALGNLEQCRQALDKALEHDAAWSSHWHFAALVAAREGKNDEARDWYFAADEWLRRDPPSQPVFAWIKGLAARSLKWPPMRPPTTTRLSTLPATTACWPNIRASASSTFAAGCGTAAPQRVARGSG